jgi:hypothetical protein
MNGSDHSATMPDGYTAIETYINEVADDLAPTSTGGSGGDDGSGDDGSGDDDGSGGDDGGAGDDGSASEGDSGLSGAASDSDSAYRDSMIVGRCSAHSACVSLLGTSLLCLAFTRRRRRYTRLPRNKISLSVAKTTELPTPVARLYPPAPSTSTGRPLKAPP